MSRELPHVLELSVLICAERSTVFRFFTNSELFARWWGEGSSIEPREGGAVSICYPGGTVVSGKVLAIDPEERIVFTYGYDAPQGPVPPGSTRVEVILREEANGTRVELRHAFPNEEVRDAHDAGWRYQLAVFCNVVCDEQNVDLTQIVDTFFAAWREGDPEKRLRMLEGVVAQGVEFRDRFGAVSGRDNLNRHIGAVRMHVPDSSIERDGEVRLCQGTAVTGWKATGADGGAASSGLDVFDLTANGRLRRIVGFWS